MRLLLDEMYPAALAGALEEAGIDAVTVADLRLTGTPDTEVFAAAQAAGRALLTENVVDFTRLAADHVTYGARGLIVLPGGNAVLDGARPLRCRGGLAAVARRSRGRQGRTG